MCYLKPFHGIFTSGWSYLGLKPEGSKDIHGVFFFGFFFVPLFCYGI